MGSIIFTGYFYFSYFPDLPSLKSEDLSSPVTPVDILGYFQSHQVTTAATDANLQDFTMKLQSYYLEAIRNIPNDATLEKLTVFYTKLALFHAYRLGLRVGTPEYNQFVGNYVDNASLLSRYINTNNIGPENFTFF